MKNQAMRASRPDPRAVLPATPVPPRTFVEDVIPALFAELELPAGADDVELRLGLVLEGGGGGEWTLHLIEGELGIEPVRDVRCELTLVQRVGDWRSALWEGRPAFVADALRALFGASHDRGGRLHRATASALDPAVVEELRSLRGRVEVRVEVDSRRAPGRGPDRSEVSDGVCAADDWWLAVQLGPGPLATRADASIALAAEQAEAIHRGELHPLEALITGQVRLEGDLGLVIQLQALALRATLAR